MEFELEQTSLLVTKNKDSPKSNTSILISEYNSSQMSPIESSYLITPIHNFSNLNHPTIKKFDFNELEKPSSKKPPILKKKPIVSQITQCNQDLISKIEINLGISNHSTENSLEMLKNSTDLINKAAIEKNERNLKNNFKPLKLKLKNLDQIKKFNFPLKKKNEDFQNPFLMNKAKIMAINENFEEFFGSPNSFISQKSDINEKNKINFIFEKEFEKISVNFFNYFV